MLQGCSRAAAEGLGVGLGGGGGGRVQELLLLLSAQSLIHATIIGEPLTRAANTHLLASTAFTIQCYVDNPVLQLQELIAALTAGCCN